MNLVEILRLHAATRPEAAALIDTRHRRSRVLTFQGLDRASARVAHRLRSAGVRPGDVALVFQPMSADLYVTLVAVLRLGVVAMFVDPWAGRDHLEHCCALCPPKALIATPRAHLLRLVSPALRRIPLTFSAGWPVPGATTLSWADTGACDDAVEPCEPGDPALLTFTSGSTGPARAALRSHGFLRAQHRVLAQSLELAPGEVDLTALPIFVLANLASGVTSLIPDADLRQPGAIDPGPVVAQIDAHRPTRVVASPAFFERLAQYCAAHGRILPAFTRLFTGGAPVFPDLLEQMRGVAPRAEITAVYGSTEAEPIAHVAHPAIRTEDVSAMLEGRGLLAGLPVPAIRLRILPDRWGTPLGEYSERAFDAACLPPGAPGEIVVSGEHVLGGYLNGRGDQETKFAVEGTRWHRTGDAGYLDPQGRLWLLGRCAARIEDPRGTLYPFAVECVARQHPGVRRAALVGHHGRRILALELDRPVADAATFRDALAWTRIDEVQVHRVIPVDRRHNAKIDYPALQALLARRSLSERS